MINDHCECPFQPYYTNTVSIYNMATSLMRSRPGHHSFRRHLSELESDPGRLAVELYSIGLVDRVARQRASLGSVVSVERSRELLQTLESKIEQDEGNFDKFLSILDRNPTMEDICEKMRVTRGTLAIIILLFSLHTNVITHNRSSYLHCESRVVYK